MSVQSSFVGQCARLSFHYVDIFARSDRHCLMFFKGNLDYHCLDSVFYASQRFCFSKSAIVSGELPEKFSPKISTSYG